MILNLFELRRYSNYRNSKLYEFHFHGDFEFVRIMEISIQSYPALEVLEETGLKSAVFFLVSLQTSLKKNQILRE